MKDDIRKQHPSYGLASFTRTNHSKAQKLSAEDKRQMKHLFEFLSVNIESNIPFFEQQFEEQMDKTVTEAKSSIDAFITNAVNQTGLETMRKEGKMLGVGGDE